MYIKIYIERGRGIESGRVRGREAGKERREEERGTEGGRKALHDFQVRGICKKKICTDQASGCKDKQMGLHQITKVLHCKGNDNMNPTQKNYAHRLMKFYGHH